MEDTRERIIEATLRLLADQGAAAISTRAVCHAANVQPPTIYRLFGDKQGLLDAVAARGCAAYLTEKADAEPLDDPVDDLRRGWDAHVRFGLANPALYALVYGEPRPERPWTALAVAAEPLRRGIHRVALAGRLSVAEQRAERLIHAAGCGTVLSLLSDPQDRRDPGVSDAAREAVIAAITTDRAPTARPGPAAAAVTLRALLTQVTELTPHERQLLGDWLDRIAGTMPR